MSKLYILPRSRNSDYVTYLSRNCYTDTDIRRNGAIEMPTLPNKSIAVIAPQPTKTEPPKQFIRNAPSIISSGSGSNFPVTRNREQVYNPPILKHHSCQQTTLAPPQQQHSQPKPPDDCILKFVDVEEIHHLLEISAGRNKGSDSPRRRERLNHLTVDEKINRRKQKNRFDFSFLFRGFS